MRPRIGIVPYLNSVPLVRALERSSSEIDLRSGTPAEIATMLGDGALDLGLTPVVAAARLRLTAVPAIGVGGCGPVRSVLLLSRVPIPEIRTLALDPASRSSAALLRLLLLREHHLEPILVDGPRTGSPLPVGADAALLIGDRALEPIDSRLRVTDLGAWWHQVTGKPFVFAMWAGPDPDRVRQLAPVVQRAAARGLDELDEIIAAQASIRALDPKLVRDYMLDALTFRLGADSMDGLQTYLSMLREAGLIPVDAHLDVLSP